MLRRTLVCLLLPLWLLAGKERKPVTGTARGENQDVLIHATIYADRDSVKELIGNDLDGHYILVAVKLEPKYTKAVKVDRDDFLLRTDRDGEKSQPFNPTQIAGRGALVIRQTSQGGGGMAENTGPVVGGIPGTMGGPMRLPGNGTAMGNGGMSDAGAAEAKADNGMHQPENPLLKVLRDKALPECEITEPVSGLLYFPMEKQKLKDLELNYGGRENRITMRFK